jgi:hypothetical protein
MISPFFGEFFGTLMLILLGDGVVACVLLKKSKAEGAGWMVITTGWAFAVMVGVFASIACGSKDAFLNPAVTLGFAISKLFEAPPAGGGPNVRRVYGRNTRLAALLASLEGNAGYRCEVSGILHRACDPKCCRELDQ